MLKITYLATFVKHRFIVNILAIMTQNIETNTCELTVLTLFRLLLRSSPIRVCNVRGSADMYRHTATLSNKTFQIICGSNFRIVLVSILRELRYVRFVSNQNLIIADG